MDAGFRIGLVLSGATAIPLETELNWLTQMLGIDFETRTSWAAGLGGWLWRIRSALHEANRHYPFLAYGTDWLAFGHFVIALAFVGAWREPVRNKWLFDFGLIACALGIPFALIFGGVRGIPFYWRLIDCSFGVFGAMPLWFCRKWAAELEKKPARR